MPSPCNRLKRPVLNRQLLTILVLLLAPLQLPAQDDAIEVISQVQSFASTANTPPGDENDWQTLELPSATRLGDPANSNRVLWLRFELDRPDSDILHSLYFYRYNLSIDVFFNGDRIGGDSYREGRQTVAWNHPRLVDIQSANWREGRNLVHVRFQGSYFGGTFSEILFGPQTSLLPLYEDRMFRQVRVNEWLQASGIVVTILVLALWTMRRRDPVYLIFTLITCAWLVLQTHMVVYHNLIEYRYWLPLVHIAIDCFLLFLCLFLTRFANVPSPRLEQALIAWTGIAIAWHCLAPMTIWWIGAYVVHALGNLFLLYLLFRIAVQAIRDRHGMSMIIAATVVVQLAFGAHDILLILRGSGEDWESAYYLTQFIFPLLLLVFTIGLLNRFVAALNLAEELNHDLERKVDASRRMIQASFQEQRALELSKATEQERLKIYRDLHDDVGSKLLSIVHAGRDHKLGELARAALSSLRDAVSRANSPQQPLAEFLAALQEETTLRLEGTGHNLTWELPQELPERILSAEIVYNLNQIVREVTSNIIRHAQAEAVTISLTMEDSGMQLDISDDGRGIAPGADDGNGNGLRHIRERAASIDAIAYWQQQPSGGTAFTLQVPLS